MQSMMLQWEISAHRLRRTLTYLKFVERLAACELVLEVHPPRHFSADIANF